MPGGAARHRCCHEFFQGFHEARAGLLNLNYRVQDISVRVAARNRSQPPQRRPGVWGNFIQREKLREVPGMDAAHAGFDTADFRTVTFQVPRGIPERPPDRDAVLAQRRTEFPAGIKPGHQGFIPTPP